jgi:DNA-binding MarR family transcriptional regulator
MPTSDPKSAARSLLNVVMLVMRAVAADMRRCRTPLAPAHMGSLIRIAASPCSMSDLARHLTVSLPTVSKSVDTLVRRGWVERWADAADRRHTMVRLTPKGRRVLADLKERNERLVARALTPLAPVERAHLVESLDVLTRSLAKPDDSCASTRAGQSVPSRVVRKRFRSIQGGASV